LGALASPDKMIRVDDFLDEYEKVHTSFVPGTIKLTQGSKDNLRKLIINLNEYYAKITKYKPNLYKISYMLATARYETYHFTTGEFFSEKPEVGSKEYFNMYDPVLAGSLTKIKRAKGLGNTVQGDGFKYRGRGCVQLTWKNNYKKASKKFDVDFVAEPDLAGDFRYAVPIMVWGMEEGIFTGKSLRDYINEYKIDYTGSRKIINAQIEAELIASFADKFEKILEKTSIIPKGF